MAALNAVAPLETVKGYEINYVDELGVVALVDVDQKKIFIHEAFKNEPIKKKILKHELAHTTGNDIWHDVKDYYTFSGGLQSHYYVLKNKGFSYYLAWAICNLKWWMPAFRFQGQMIENQSWKAAALANFLLAVAWLVATKDGSWVAFSLSFSLICLAADLK